MAAFAPTLSFDFPEEIHREHESLLGGLMEFERALDSIDCESEVFANLVAVGETIFLTRRLVYQLQEYFTREEEMVLVPLAEIKPRLGNLVAKLRREHEGLSGRLAVFAMAVEELDSSDDFYDAIWQMKEQGKGLVCAILQHVASEERELADACDGDHLVNGSMHRYR